MVWGRREATYYLYTALFLSLFSSSFRAVFFFFAQNSSPLFFLQKEKIQDKKLEFNYVNYFYLH